MAAQNLLKWARNSSKFLVEDTGSAVSYVQRQETILLTCCWNKLVGFFLLNLFLIIMQFVLKCIYLASIYNFIILYLSSVCLIFYFMVTFSSLIWEEGCRYSVCGAVQVNVWSWWKLNKPLQKVLWLLLNLVCNFYDYDTNLKSNQSC